MNFYILIEDCCRHFEGVFTNLQEIAEYLGIKENKEWTLDELRKHDWLNGYSIGEFNTEELGKPTPAENDTPLYDLDDLLYKYGKKYKK